MIGVLSKNSEIEIVTEFFQLFKTPWEFYDKDKEYDVLVITSKDFDGTNARLVIIYDSEENAFDLADSITISPLNKNVFLQYEDGQIPVYGNISTVTGKGQSFLPTNNSAEKAAIKIERSNQTVIRIGYNLFSEVSFLLSSGQPPTNALIPTLDLHISVLRSLIAQAGIPFVEIPPIPAGYSFITCLTHDIDFIRIKDHKFDHTMWGFLYRATIGTLLNVMNGKNNWKDLFQNWKAILTLPLVYLGLATDYWFKFDRYMQLEKNVNARSTFFLIPFKNRIGGKVPGKDAKRRAAKYDVRDIQDTVKKLVNSGFEVGVHGIDAWHDVTMARQELLRISEVAKQPEVGIRVHWLCFDENTPYVLETAGFSYDTTFGYNDAVGYRTGSSQAFKPISVKNILELPLNIQDTALFNPKHMSLTKKQAWDLYKRIVEKTYNDGGVLTILWHDRSLSPERLYEYFYIRLLDDLKKHKTWFATASQACDWFRRRRTIQFDDVIFSENHLHLKLNIEQNETIPQIKLRIYHLDIKKHANGLVNQQPVNYKEINWNGETDFVIKL
jgi:hypothetical protein